MKMEKVDSNDDEKWFGRTPPHMTWQTIDKSPDWTVIANAFVGAEKEVANFLPLALQFLELRLAESAEPYNFYRDGRKVRAEEHPMSRVCIAGGAAASPQSQKARILGQFFKTHTLNEQHSFYTNHLSHTVHNLIFSLEKKYTGRRGSKLGENTNKQHRVSIFGGDLLA